MREQARAYQDIFQGTHYILSECEHTLRTKRMGKKRFSQSSLMPRVAAQCRASDTRIRGRFLSRKSLSLSLSLSIWLAFTTRRRCEGFALPEEGIIVLPRFRDVYEMPRLHKYVTKILQAAWRKSIFL